MGARRFPDLSPLRYTALTRDARHAVDRRDHRDRDARRRRRRARRPATTAPSWWRLLYVAGPAAVVAVLAWNDGVKRLGPANGSLFINLVPVVTFAIAIGQGYRPGAAEIAGAGAHRHRAGRRRTSSRAARQASARPVERRVGRDAVGEPLKSRA